MTKAKPEKPVFVNCQEDPGTSGVLDVIGGPSVPASFCPHKSSARDDQS